MDVDIAENQELTAEYRKKAAEIVSRMTLEEKVSQTLHKSAAVERMGIKGYNWWNEALHGVARAGTATVFPQAIGLAAAFDTEMMKEIGSVIATEGRAKYNQYAKAMKGRSSGGYTRTESSRQVRGARRKRLRIHPKAAHRNPEPCRMRRRTIKKNVREMYSEAGTSRL